MLIILISIQQIPMMKVNNIVELADNSKINIDNTNILVDGNYRLPRMTK